jgi:hypothetical protein
MNIKITSISIFLVSSILFFSCTKDKRLMYEDDPRVFFYKNTIGSQADPDSINYNFSFRAATVQIDTVYLWLRIMGSAQNKDREVSIIAKENSTAKRGYNYEFGPLVIPANQYEARIPVYVYKQPGLKDSIMLLDLAIGESKDFKPGYTDRGATWNQTDRLTYRIYITDQLTKPSNWDTQLLPVYGTYSRVKFQYMISVTGRTNWSGLLPQDGNFLAQQVKVAYYNYVQANGPLIDEFGNPVVFP